MAAVKSDEFKLEDLLRVKSDQHCVPSRIGDHQTVQCLKAKDFYFPIIILNQKYGS